MAGQVADCQPNGSHPLLVNLLAPDFSTAEAIEKMITCVATSLARLTGLPADNIFVHYRTAGSGTVFDAGKIVTW